MDQQNKLTEIRKIEGALEAILFAAGHPVSYDKIGEALELTPGDAKRIAEHLADKYNNNADGGIMMLVFPDTCQLCTREDYIPQVRIALGIRRGGNLSNSALEVLAIVAYNQPVTRSFVDAVRGVDSAYAVGSLLDKGLIEPCGRLDAPGRPTLLATTEKFLRVFGLSNLGELPEGGALRGAAEALICNEEEDEGEQLKIEDTPAASEDEPEELYSPEPDEE
ncbi:MAG: SMC-Scp complex subunit ScpB [Eubacteriales bacterium]